MDTAGDRRPALLVIAKAPRPGAVKTRLVPPCTPAQAAALARAALADTLAAAAAVCGASRVVLALDGDPAGIVPDGIEVVPQADGTLDRRLAGAFEAVGGPALLIGMDTPQVGAGELDDALVTLCRPGVDAVLGPAPDGGFWAIGLRRPGPDAFVGIPMSTPRTGRLQHRRLVERGDRVELLAVRRDVDDFEDALAVAAEAPGSRFARRLAELDVAGRGTAGGAA